MMKLNSGKYFKVGLLWALLILGIALSLMSHSIRGIENLKGIALAKYDLQKGHPKIFIYGLVREEPLRKIWGFRGVEPVFRGCMVGELEYMDRAYNKEVINNLNLNGAL